jgi:hypothetical protein
MLLQATMAQPSATLAAQHELIPFGVLAHGKVGRSLLVICFLREAPERAIGSDRRAGKWGLLKEPVTVPEGGEMGVTR